MLKKNFLFVYILVFMFSILGCYKENDVQNLKLDNGLINENVENGTKVITKQTYLSAEIEITGNIEEDDIQISSKYLFIKEKKDSKINLYIAIIGGEEDNIDFVINNYENLNIKISKAIMKKDFLNLKGNKKVTAEVLLGDYNVDGEVNLQDFNVFKQNFGKNSTTYDIGPASMGTDAWSGIYCYIHSDGKVGLEDLTVFASNFGKKNPQEIEIYVSSVKAIISNTSLKIGETATVELSILPDNATDKRVDWYVDVKSVIELSADAKTIKAIGEGTAIITVTSKNGKTDKVTVSVTEDIFTGIELHAKYTHLWGWNKNGVSGNISASWPGQEMEAEGNGWYKYYLSDAKSLSLLFSNAGSDKTGNLSITKEGKYWFNGTEFVNSNPDKDTEAPKVSVLPNSAKENNGTLYYEESALQVNLEIKDNQDTSPKAYYTVNGTIPTVTSTQYNGEKITITNDMTLKVLTLDKDGNSKIYTYIFKLNQDITVPVISANPDGGKYPEGTSLNVKLSVTDNRDNAPKIYYTTDGKTPLEDFNYFYNGETIKISSTTTINILAVDASGNKSEKRIVYVIGNNSDDWDFREETIYFLMTARFYDGDSSNNLGKKGDPADDPSWRGDLQGLIQKLDYIKAMGFTAVWVTPPVENDSAYDYHGYHASNFHNIESKIGGMENYKKFIEAAHSKGMKVVQDVVFNHSGPKGLTHPNGHFALGTNAYHNQGQIRNWEGYICQTGDMAGADCSDFNTENEEVLNVIIDAFGQYIDMGVDAFRVDTVKHINRLIFNEYLNPAMHKRAEENGRKFYMFGEVCTRVHDVWNKGVYSLSTPFYTWKERNTFSGSLTEQVKSAYDWENSQEQPTSDNAFLNGNEYHEPDYSKNSGLGVIDFPMHWNFSDAYAAFNFASNYDNDKFYNDSTWNVMYVDSHDYGPNSDNRYAGGTDAWAGNMSLMWTFRGIPCIYYGSEIEFKAGAKIDNGAPPLSVTGRAYYGDYLEGTVTATDFSEFTATGNIADTLNKPLVGHLRDLNRIRSAIPALQKGQYSREDISGDMAFKRRYTKNGIDSFALVTIEKSAVFNNIPNGKYVDAVTGDVKNVTNNSLSVSCSGAGNMRVYVLDLPGNPAPLKMAKYSSFLK